MKAICRVLLILVLISFSAHPLLSQRTSDEVSGRPVHTYSIVARDPDTGDIGVAVQSHWFSVGSVVSWAEAGAGAVATQSLVNVSFGPRGLELLKKGKTAQEALTELIVSDEGREVRQLAIVDAKGTVAAHTGTRCIPEAGHHLGNGYSVQANLMLNDRIVPAMAKAFEEARGPLAERMVSALEAAQAAGGDIRGKQSASITVVRGTPTGNVWEDRMIDLRVEDHAEPLLELKRILSLHRAYEYMNQGDLAMEKNDIEGALAAYKKAEEMFPDNLEMKFWHAVSLVNAGMTDEALPLFRHIFSKDENWRTLTKRLPAVGMLNVNEEVLKRIVSE
jgi:uncharacterized Ntn-hydrolase superfamily protein